MGYFSSVGISVTLTSEPNYPQNVCVIPFFQCIVNNQQVMAQVNGQRSLGKAWRKRFSVSLPTVQHLSLWGPSGPFR